MTTATQPEGFGVADYNAGKFNRWHLGPKFKDIPVFRILPPAKGNKKFVEYYALHWGYGVTGVDSKTGKEYLAHRLWGCIREDDRKTKMITRECPECQLIAASEFKKKSLEVDKDNHKISLAEFQTLVAHENGFLAKHNRSGKYYLNALNTSGDLGLLDIPGKAFKAMKKCFEDALKMGIDPTRPDQGILVRFSWTGSGFNTEYACDIVKETIAMNGQVAEVVKKAPLTPEQLQTLPSQCWDLRSTAVSCAITEAQAYQIVESRGDSKIIEGIFGASTARTTSDSGMTDVVEDEVFATPTATATATPTFVDPPPTLATQTAVDPAQAQLIAALQAQLAALQAAPASVVSTPPQVVTTTESKAAPTLVSSADLAKMSPQDFIARFGKGSTVAG